MSGVDDDVPPFETLYDCSDRSPITPRMAYYLWASAVDANQMWATAPEMWLEDLPPVAQRYAHATPDWLEQFARSFLSVAARLAMAAIDNRGLAGCTAEEVALHLTFDYAPDWLDDRMLELPADVAHRLPECGDRDRDFEEAHDLLFEDHDVLDLWEPARDGIENVDDELDYVNLHPRDWFNPFDT